MEDEGEITPEKMRELLDEALINFTHLTDDQGNALADCTWPAGASTCSTSSIVDPPVTLEALAKLLGAFPPPLRREFVLDGEVYCTIDGESGEMRITRQRWEELYDLLPRTTPTSVMPSLGGYFVVIDDRSLPREPTSFPLAAALKRCVIVKAPNSAPSRSRPQI